MGQTSPPLSGTATRGIPVPSLQLPTNPPTALELGPADPAQAAHNTLACPIQLGGGGGCGGMGAAAWPDVTPSGVEPFQGL